MNKAIAILGGLGASVAAAYFLDSKKGASRRAMVLDKFHTLKEDASQKFNEMSEGLKNQAGSFGDAKKGMIGDGQHSSQPQQQFKPGTPGHSTAM